jgi:hypothetical protein
MKKTFLIDKNGKVSSKRIGGYTGLVFGFGMIISTFFVDNDKMTTELILGVLGLAFTTLMSTLVEKEKIPSLYNQDNS